MNTAKLSGLILIGLGIIVLAYQGFTYTTREKVIDFGPVQVTAEKQHSLPLPPIVGGLALAAGVVLLALKGGKS